MESTRQAPVRLTVMCFSLGEYYDGLCCLVALLFRFALECWRRRVTVRASASEAEVG
jgi:hypothetical protein